MTKNKEWRYGGWTFSQWLIAFVVVLVVLIMLANGTICNTLPTSNYTNGLEWTSYRTTCPLR